MWKQINATTLSVHPNATFQAYLDAIPTEVVPFDEPIGFHYMVDLDSNTYLRRVEGDLPLEDSDEYRVLREQMECESKPIFFKKINEVRRREGIPDADKPTEYTKTMMQDDYDTCSAFQAFSTFSSAPDLDAMFNVAVDTKVPPSPPPTSNKTIDTVDIIDPTVIPAPIKTLDTSDNEEKNATLPQDFGAFDMDTSIGDIIEAAQAQRTRIRAREKADKEKEPPRQRLKRTSIREQDEATTNQKAEQRQDEVIDLTGEDDKTEEDKQLAINRKTATERAKAEMQKRYYREGANRSMTFAEYLEKNRIEYLYAIESQLSTILMRLRRR
jgi:hypothetical protein